MNDLESDKNGQRHDTASNSFEDGTHERRENFIINCEMELSKVLVKHSSLLDEEKTRDLFYSFLNCPAKGKSSSGRKFCTSSVIRRLNKERQSNRPGNQLKSRRHKEIK